jgi:hypothetical protein
VRSDDNRTRRDRASADTAEDSTTNTAISETATPRHTHDACNSVGVVCVRLGRVITGSDRVLFT